ncbi:MAG: hypothetical protein IEMM0008_0747 [bacterium]|nr:MAG: hypothetical protein IEMM0008_0747 [bacterium]
MKSLMLVVSMILSLMVISCGPKTVKEAQTDKLHDAVEDGNVEGVKQAILKEADVNGKAGFADETPLHIAVKEGRFEIIKILIANGAFVNVRDAFGLTPLYVAAYYGRPKAAKILL